MTASVTRAILWLLIVLMVVALGWNKPLRYRFMTPEQIAQSERAEDAENLPSFRPVPTPWQPQSTTLNPPAESHPRHR
jgi:hypothetical protein